MCEDVREEIGNKKSLLGVFGGDVAVDVFPARVRIAFYAEYVPPKDAGEQELKFGITIADSIAVKGSITIPPTNDVAILVIPQGVAQFKSEGDLVLKVSEGDEEIELIRKRIILKSQMAR